MFHHNSPESLLALFPLASFGVDEEWGNEGLLTYSQVLLAIISQYRLEPKWRILLAWYLAQILFNFRLLAIFHVCADFAQNWDFPNFAFWFGRNWSRSEWSDGAHHLCHFFISLFLLFLAFSIQIRILLLQRSIWPLRIQIQQIRRKILRPAVSAADQGRHAIIRGQQRIGHLHSEAQVFQVGLLGLARISHIRGHDYNN